MGLKCSSLKTLLKFRRPSNREKLMTGRLTVCFQEGLYSICFQRQDTSEVPNRVILEHVKSEGAFCPMLNSASRHEGLWRN